MDPSPEIQGMRVAILQWVERVTFAGRVHYRISYQFVNHRNGSGKQSIIRTDQIYPNPHVGDYVRVHFCLSRVLRVEKAY